MHQVVSMLIDIFCCSSTHLSLTTWALMNCFLKFDSLNVWVICRKKGKNNLSVITVLSLFPLSAQPRNMVVNGELTMLMRNRVQFSSVPSQNTWEWFRQVNNLLMQCLFLHLLHKDGNGQDASSLEAILNIADVLLNESPRYVIWWLFPKKWAHEPTQC